MNPIWRTDGDALVPWLHVGVERVVEKVTGVSSCKNTYHSLYRPIFLYSLIARKRNKTR